MTVLGLQEAALGHPHPGGNPGANLESISHKCHPILVAFVWEFTEETIYSPLGCLQGGVCLRVGPHSTTQNVNLKH